MGAKSHLLPYLSRSVRKFQAPCESLINCAVLPTLPRLFLLGWDPAAPAAGQFLVGPAQNASSKRQLGRTRRGRDRRVRPHYRRNRYKNKRPVPCFRTKRGVTLATSYFRVTYRYTIIGAAAFHFRVRNGNGWCHCAGITRRLW